MNYEFFTLLHVRSFHNHSLVAAFAFIIFFAAVVVVVVDVVYDDAINNIIILIVMNIINMSRIA
jgi:hypothetical protein